MFSKDIIPLVLIYLFWINSDCFHSLCYKNDDCYSSQKCVYDHYADNHGCCQCIPGFCEQEPGLKLVSFSPVSCICFDYVNYKVSCPESTTYIIEFERELIFVKFIEAFSLKSITSVAIQVDDSSGDIYKTGIITSTSDGSILTNSSWKCTNQNQINDSWMSDTFNDSSWPDAVQRNQGSQGWPTIQGTGMAKWIRTNRPEDTSYMYCRVQLGLSSTTTTTKNAAPTTSKASATTTTTTKSTTKASTTTTSLKIPEFRTTPENETTTQFNADANGNNPSNSKVFSGAIIGAVVGSIGGILLVLLLVFLICFLLKKRRKSNEGLDSKPNVHANNYQDLPTVSTVPSPTYENGAYSPIDYTPNLPPDPDNSGNVYEETAPSVYENTHDVLDYADFRDIQRNSESDGVPIEVSEAGDENKTYDNVVDPRSSNRETIINDDTVLVENSLYSAT